MKKYCMNLAVRSVEHLNEKCTLLKLTSDEMLPEMLPGQFVEVRVDGSPSTFLRRPISIHNFDRESNELWLLVAAVGEGTRKVCAVHDGERLNCIMPLGNSFTFGSAADGGAIKRQLLIGGGVGIAPLYFLGKEIRRCGGEPVFLIGARTASDLIETDLYESLGKVHVTTEDGSCGEKGFVTNHSVLGTECFDWISVCGPKPMMMAVANHARKIATPCEVSLENRMACGLGACLCCVEKTVEGNLCVCKEGPVFNIDRLLWHD